MSKYNYQINDRENPKGNTKCDGQSRDTVDIGYTRLRTNTYTKKNKKKNKNAIQKTKKMNNTDPINNRGCFIPYYQELAAK
jgi:hypothetical protein